MPAFSEDRLSQRLYNNNVHDTLQQKYINNQPIVRLDLSGNGFISHSLFLMRMLYTVLSLINHK